MTKEMKDEEKEDYDEKQCAICGFINPKSVDICGNCRSSLIIARVRQQNRLSETAIEPSFRFRLAEGKLEWTLHDKNAEHVPHYHIDRDYLKRNHYYIINSLCHDDYICKLIDKKLDYDLLRVEYHFIVINKGEVEKYSISINFGSKLYEDDAIECFGNLEEEND